MFDFKIWSSKEKKKKARDIPWKNEMKNPPGCGRELGEKKMENGRNERRKVGKKVSEK